MISLDEINSRYCSQRDTLMSNSSIDDVFIIQEKILSIKTWQNKFVSLHDEMIRFTDDLPQICTSVEVNPAPIENEQTPPKVSDNIEPTIDATSTVVDSEEPTVNAPTVVDSTVIDITIFGKSHSVPSWSKVLVIVTEALISKEPYKIIGFPTEQKLLLNGESLFSYEITWNTSPGKTVVKPHKLSNGMYVETNIDNCDITDLCCNMLSFCGYNKDNITFLL